MSKISSQAEVTMNVRVVVGRPEPNGKLSIRTERRFKNTATRFMTESICYYLTGSENSYKRGKSRPNYMGLGTMGITKQNNLDTADTADNFSVKTYEPGETTRPWFESTSLGLTTVCGAVNPDERGISTHFWDPEYGWGKDAFEDEPSDEPIYQGELCTALQHAEGDEPYEDIERLPILRADTLSDCPADWDYGSEGYGSEAIFYAYASVEWVHKLLHPDKGPQLDRMGISEFGLYEKNNTDPHGLETMMAGFRVPTPEDIVYVSDGEVVLIEWRVIVRALMPSEGVTVVSEPAPTGIQIVANDVDEKTVDLTAVVRGPAGVRQNVSWEMDDSYTGTTLTATGVRTARLHIAEDDPTDIIYVTASSVVDPWVLCRSVIMTGLIKNLITGITITTESVSALSVQLAATVLGKGTFRDDVTWSMTGQDPEYTTHIDPDTGLITVDFDDPAEYFVVTATSNGDPEVFSVAAVVRIDKTSGSYVISDFTILT